MMARVGRRGKEGGQGGEARTEDTPGAMRDRMNIVGV